MSPIPKMVLFAVCLSIWALNLYIFNKIKNQAAFMVIGMAGMFILMMVFIRPVLTDPTAKLIAALTGIVGKLTGTFSVYLRYGMLFISTPDGSMTLKVDFECSGIVEIMIYLSILCFYRVYNLVERVILSVAGVIYIILSNAIRITAIALIIHSGGEQAYYIAHTYIGRLIFYALTIILYFYVFTKSQVMRMQVGSFSYDKGGSDGKQNT